MIEQKIEQQIIKSLKDELRFSSVTDVEILGAWQPASSGDIKGVEGESARGYLTVKVSPRSHETFTIPEASFSVSVNLNVRTEIDADGAGYLTITDTISALIYDWQKRFATYYNTFTIANEFEPTGFRLDGGDCGVDRQNGIWTWIQNFTVHGIIQN